MRLLRLPVQFQGLPEHDPVMIQKPLFKTWYDLRKADRCQHPATCWKGSKLKKNYFGQPFFDVAAPWYL